MWCSSSKSVLGIHDDGLVEIQIAGPGDVPQLARLLWLHSAPEERTTESVESFEIALARWCRDHATSHLAFIARATDTDVVGMAWLALLPRVPRPGALARLSADLQSVFVVPEHRGKGVGSTLVDTATKHAVRLGAGRVTVSSGRKAVPVYERLGFAPSRELLQRLS